MINVRCGEPCPDCGGDVLPVVYGMPGEDAMRATERSELFLGGCTLDDDIAFRCACGTTTCLFDDCLEG